MSEAASRQGVRTGDETKDYIFSRTYIYLYLFVSIDCIAAQREFEEAQTLYFISCPFDPHIYIYIHKRYRILHKPN